MKIAILGTEYDTQDSASAKELMNRMDKCGPNEMRHIGYSLLIALLNAESTKKEG